MVPAAFLVSFRAAQIDGAADWAALAGGCGAGPCFWCRAPALAERQEGGVEEPGWLRFMDGHSSCTRERRRVAIGGYSAGDRPPKLVFLAYESCMTAGEAEVSARSLTVVVSLGCWRSGS